MTAPLWHSSRLVYALNIALLIFSPTHAHTTPTNLVPYAPVLSTLSTRLRAVLRGFNPRLSPPLPSPLSLLLPSSGNGKWCGGLANC